MKKIAASILGKENKATLINKLINNGIEIIHYDVMDGKFVNNFSLPTKEVLELFNNTHEHYKDVHLMVNEPTEYLEQLFSFADQISVHVESINPHDLNELINKYADKVKLGLVVNPDTKIDVVFEHLQKLNHVMIMSVVPGRGGQTFIEASLDKIISLSNEIKTKELSTIIEIDGGINDIWGPKVFELGVNIAVSGSYLINNLEDDSINKILGKK